MKEIIYGISEYDWVNISNWYSLTHPLTPLKRGIQFNSYSYCTFYLLAFFILFENTPLTPLKRGIQYPKAYTKGGPAKRGIQLDYNSYWNLKLLAFCLYTFKNTPLPAPGRPNPSQEGNTIPKRLHQRWTHKEGKIHQYSIYPR